MFGVVDQTAEAAQLPEADVVEHEDQHVRCPGRRADRRGQAGLDSSRRPPDHTREGAARLVLGEPHRTVLLSGRDRPSTRPNTCMARTSSPGRDEGSLEVCSLTPPVGGAGSSPEVSPRGRSWRRSTRSRPVARKSTTTATEASRKASRGPGSRRCRTDADGQRGEHDHEYGGGEQQQAADGHPPGDRIGGAADIATRLPVELVAGTVDHVGEEQDPRRGQHEQRSLDDLDDRGGGACPYCCASGRKAAAEPVPRCWPTPAVR